jgi:hypothetical protein
MPTAELQAAYAQFEQSPTSRDHFNALAKALNDNKNHAEVLRLADLFESKGGPAMVAQRQRRSALFALRRYDDALAAARPLYDREKANADDAVWLLRILTRLERFDEVASTGEAAQARWPDNANIGKYVDEAQAKLGGAEPVAEKPADGPASAPPAARTKKSKAGSRRRGRKKG